ncbi:MAG: hypothetical protein ACT4QF_04650 [Sporichthyaceae bacterium]
MTTATTGRTAEDVVEKRGNRPRGIGTAAAIGFAVGCLLSMIAVAFVEDLHSESPKRAPQSSTQQAPDPSQLEIAVPR